MSVDLKFEMDGATVYLDDAVKTLRIMTEALECEMLAAQRNDFRPIPEWILERCCGFSIIVRELDRITDELKAAVTKEYRSGKGEYT
ncbi:hypothetical protein [Flavonifractor sp. AGMB03687]|uniref:hypothetical protein n=1 Tax=Flavonifractor sp. AGMB03687 TaxID=2785133 RepID=UPI001AE07E54|nr:hypothetical protein [Flavonifractor sp. AGMB03687]